MIFKEVSYGFQGTILNRNAYKEWMRKKTQQPSCTAGD
jgi:hypothetical protein